MKTVKKANEYKRVTDDVAKNMVKKDGWIYCKKMEWKEKVRGFIKQKPITPKTVKKSIEKEVKKEVVAPVVEKTTTNKKPSKYQAKKAAAPVEPPMSDEARKILENTAEPKTVRKQKKDSKKTI